MPDYNLVLIKLFAVDGVKYIQFYSGIKFEW